MKSKTRQPSIKPGVKYGFDIIPVSEAIQELPDPEGHLTEEQKKWPISGYVSLPVPEVPVSELAQSGEPNPSK